MDSFGQKLREAIESRGLSLEYVARATGIDIVHLQALERDDLGALPEDESVTEGLQAIARLVDVEPDEVVNDFLRERQQRRRTEVIQPDDELVRDAQQRADVVTREPASRMAGFPLFPALTAVASVLALAGIIWLSWSGSHETAPADAVSRNTAPMAPAGSPDTADAQPASGGEMESPTGQGTVPDGDSPGQGIVPGGDFPVSAGQSQVEAVRVSETSAPDAASEPSSPVAPNEPSAPLALAGRSETSAPVPAIGNSQTSTAAPPAAGAVTPSGLAITQYGVGTGVVNHQLIGEAERFAEGTRVWFWTWVNGATAGETIRHVWLHDGREMLSVPLRLGGERWRTQSYKNLHPGSTGQWVVEARDESGHVLARQVFQCFGSAAD